MGAEQSGSDSGIVVDGFVPDPTTELDAFINSKPVTRGIFGQVSGDLEDGIYVSMNALSPNVTAENLPRIISVVPQPGARLGAGDSHHQVAFGDVALSIGDLTAMIEVAMKPFEGTEPATHEHDCMTEVRARGFDTFRPLAIGVNGEKSYLITERRRDIKTLDNDDWTISPSDPEYERVVVPNLAFSAQNIAELHAHGIFHDDMQPKNIARTDTGDFLVLDFETSKIAHGHDEFMDLVKTYGDIRDSEALRDVQHFWHSLIHPTTAESANVFLEGESVETCMEVFKRDFLDVYLEALRKHADGATIDALRTEELAETLYQRVLQTT